MNTKQIIVYSAKLCGDCRHLEAFLDRHDIPYEIRDIHKEPRHGEELQQKVGKLSVPYIVIDGEWKRGYEPGKPFSDAFAKELLGMA